MKKFLSVILAGVFALSLAACAKKEEAKPAPTTNTTTSAPKKDEFKPKEVTKFADILDNLGNKDNYFTDSSVIKLTTPSKTFNTNVAAIVEKAMKDQSVDMKNTKTYTYYNNIKGVKNVKVFVVAFDASKAPTAFYEVNITVDDKDVPAFKDTKKLNDSINDAFKTNFAKEVQ